MDFRLPSTVTLRAFEQINVKADDVRKKTQARRPNSVFSNETFDSTHVTNMLKFGGLQVTQVVKRESHQKN